MNPKAKSEFLKKISTNGFSITEEGNTLTLSPRGAEATAEVTIQEVEPNVWKVAGGAGAYAAFGRGKKRLIFEQYINEWVAGAVLQITSDEALELLEKAGIGDKIEFPSALVKDGKGVRLCQIYHSKDITLSRCGDEIIAIRELPEELPAAPQSEELPPSPTD